MLVYSKWFKHDINIVCRNFLNGSINTYQNYIKKYQGTKLKCFYSVNKYIQLIEKITVKEIEQYPILVKKRNKDYLIIDGLHRACIALF